MLSRMATLLNSYLMYKALISGALIGIANLIPGISGATIAVMTNQYKRIMNECDQIISGQFKAIDYRYLCAIIGSAVMGIVLFSRPLHYVMLHYEEVALWAISGLVLGSIKAVKIAHPPIPFKVQLKHPLFGIGVGSLIALIIMDANGYNMSGQASHAALFVSGMLAMIAMLIPGISGSMLLIILGTYTTVLGGIKIMSISILLPFIVGVIVGGIGAVKGVQWALRNNSVECQALASGLLMGSVIFMINKAGGLWGSSWAGVGLFLQWQYGLGW